MPIKHIIKPHEKSLGEFNVRRSLPSPEQMLVGPWIFFDHMGPAEFAPGQGVNVRPHPHINLATVTYLFEGEILHRDCVGSYQTINPGDVNLMVAGKGITHSERETEAVHNSRHSLHGLQLWHALPEADEEIDPAFYHYPAADIPTFSADGISGRVMMGTAYGKTSPVKTFAETLYCEAFMDASSVLTTPNAEQLAIYVVCGEVEINGEPIEEFSMVILEDNTQVNIKAVQASQIAIIGGEKFGQRFIEWNFVSSRPERIEHAKQDWREGKFNQVVGDEDEFIPLP